MQTDHNLPHFPDSHNRIAKLFTVQSLLWLALALALAGSLKHLATVFASVDGNTALGWVQAIAIDAGVFALSMALQKRRQGWPKDSLGHRRHCPLYPHFCLRQSCLWTGQRKPAQWQVASLGGYPNALCLGRIIAHPCPVPGQSCRKRHWPRGQVGPTRSKTNGQNCSAAGQN